MQVVLRIANGKSNVRQVRLKSNTTIGRSPDCQLKVASNQISRRHCEIIIRDFLVAIKDLGSANGTFVNGRQIPAEMEVPLTPGTRVALGPLQFTVEYEIPGMLRPASPSAPTHADETLPLSESDTDSKTSGDDSRPAASQPARRTDSNVTSESSGSSQPVNQSEWLASQLAPAAKTNVVPAIPVNRLPSVLPSIAPSTSSSETQTLPSSGVPTFSPPVAKVVAVPATPVGPEVFLPDPNTLGPATRESDAFESGMLESGRELSPHVSAEFFDPTETASMQSDEEQTFNFGIYAESGSGVSVESSDEIPIDLAPASPAKPVEPKTEKKGLFGRFGWGKKKGLSESSEPPVTSTSKTLPMAKAPAPDSVSFVPVALDQSPFEPAVEMPEDVVVEDEAEDNVPPPQDESLENFFNQFK